MSPVIEIPLGFKSPTKFARSLPARFGTGLRGKVNPPTFWEVSGNVFSQ